MQPTCPDAAVWQTYLNGPITTADRASAESHLAGCPLCRERLIGLFDAASEQEITETAPPALKRQALELTSAPQTRTGFIDVFRPFVPVALAATILLAIGISFVVYRNRTGTETVGNFRQSQRLTTDISLTSPPNGATVNSGKLEFSWHDAGAGARYQFVLTDEKGDIVFQEKAAINPLSLDTAALRLSSQRKYYWSVTARLPDGTRRESGIADFTLK